MMDDRHSTQGPGTAQGWGNQLVTRDGSQLNSPYSAGARLSSNMRWPTRGHSPYFVGSGGLSLAARNRLNIPESGSSFDWGDAELADAQVENEEWGTSLQAEALVDTRTGLNEALGRINALDGRDRANHNTQATVSMPMGLAVVDYSPNTVYSAPPTAQVTQGCAIGVHNFGQLGCAVSADGDGTYTFSISAENADPLAAHDISIDIKGSVGDSEDIDP